VLRAAPLFLAGLLLARLVETAALARAGAQALALAGCAVTLADAALGGSDLLAVLALAAVIVGCGAAPAGRPWPGAAQGAKLSFSLFLTHTLSGVVFFDVIRPVLLRAGGGVAAQWGLWFAGLGFALAVAWCFDRWVDQPIQRRLAAVGFSLRPAPRPATSPSG
jgi:peptidoglycan/LPS O-acetylase OafA/YrhL